MTMTTDSHPAIEVLVSGIQMGHYDADLRRIESEAKRRGKIVAAATAATLKVGTRVRIAAENISPKYLFGNTGTVTAVDRGRNGRAKLRLKVQLDEQFRARAGRFVDFDGCIVGDPTLFEAELEEG